MKLLAICTVLTTLLISPLCAADVDMSAEVYKEKLRSYKRDIITLNFSFKDEKKAEAFWEIYNDFEKKLKPLSETYLALLVEYEENYEKMSPEIATKLVENMKEYKENRSALLFDAHKKIADKVSPIDAARFVQLENRIALMVELSAATELPLLLPEGVEVSKEGAIIIITE